MPAYNVSSYIGEAISSVLAQNFTDYELLIIDDGSTDDTTEIVQLFTDRRIRLIRQPHAGIAAALNLGLKEARAGLVARFDADDICLPGRLTSQYQFLIINVMLFHMKRLLIVFMISAPSFIQPSCTGELPFLK